MEISISTQKRCEVVDVTPNVQKACRQWGGTGLAQVYCPTRPAAWPSVRSSTPPCGRMSCSGLNGRFP